MVVPTTGMMCYFPREVSTPPVMLLSIYDLTNYIRP